MGHVISKIDPAKIQGVQEVSTPQNKHDVNRLLGMLNHLQEFAPNLSEVTAPMRELLKEETISCGMKKFKVEVLRGSNNPSQNLLY